MVLSKSTGNYQIFALTEPRKGKSSARFPTAVTDHESPPSIAVPAAVRPPLLLSSEPTWVTSIGWRIHGRACEN